MHRGIALAALVSLVACGRTWPHQVTTLTSSDLRAAPVRSIDILPLDLEVWTHGSYQRDAGDVRLAAEARIVGVASETFYRRGYSVGAVLDWNGAFVGPDGSTQVALDPDSLLATIDSLARYGTAVGQTASLPAPFLPARLGERTASDATLYIGGWGFVGKESNTGATVAKIAVGTILVLGVVIVIAAIAKSDKLDPLGKVVGGAGKAVAQTAASVGRTAIKASLNAGTAVYHVGKAVVEAPEGPRLLLDILGRTATHLQLVPDRPVWSNDKSLPRSGRPQMYLEMTLVDNRSGVVLWHAHQQFPANAARPGDVMKATRALLASLPPS